VKGIAPHMKLYKYQLQAIEWMLKVEKRLESEGSIFIALFYFILFVILLLTCYVIATFYCSIYFCFILELPYYKELTQWKSLYGTIYLDHKNKKIVKPSYLASYKEKCRSLGIFLAYFCYLSFTSLPLLATLLMWLPLQFFTFLLPLPILLQ
jgi:hypothetical protein